MRPRTRPHGCTPAACDRLLGFVLHCGDGVAGRRCRSGNPEGQGAGAAYVAGAGGERGAAPRHLPAGCAGSGPGATNRN